MSPDGSNLRNLSSHRANDREPTWSPDGAKILFTSNRSGNDDVFVMNFDGSGVTQLTSHVAADGHPGWSPDGSRILFSSMRSGDLEIYVMKGDGSGLTRLTSHPGPDIAARFSPDGRRIAFVSNCDSTSDTDICIMDADGGNLRALNADGGNNDDAPSWSADGELVVFSTHNGSNRDVVVARADFTDVMPRVLVSGDSNETSPEFSPDGQWIVFSSNRAGRYAICRSTSSGADVACMDSGAGADDGTPTWQARAVFTVTAGHDVYATANQYAQARVILTGSVSNGSAKTVGWFDSLNQPVGSELTFSLTLSPGIYTFTFMASDGEQSSADSVSVFVSLPSVAGGSSEQRLEGVAGPQGEQGPRGEPGPAGERGPQGIAGPPGPSGDGMIPGSLLLMPEGQAPGPGYRKLGRSFTQEVVETDESGTRRSRMVIVIWQKL